MRSLRSVAVWAGLLAAAIAPASGAEEPLLVVEGASEHGLVVARTDFTWWTSRGAEQAALDIEAAARPGGEAVPVQFVPDSDYDAGSRATGCVVLKLPGGGDWELQLTLRPRPAHEAAPPAGEVRSKHFRMTFDAEHMRGLPCAVTFAGTGKPFDNFVWNDRLYDRDLGCFWLRYDPDVKPEVVSEGPLCTVVRIHARYCQAGGAQPASAPEAVYDWYVFREAPLVFVTAAVRQELPHAWHELHFLELNFPDDRFTRWAGGEPLEQGEFTATEKSFNTASWGALVVDRDAVGMLGSPVKFCDGRGGYGTYIHSTWRAWGERDARMATWLWIGSSDDPVQAVREAAGRLGGGARARLTRPGLRQAIADLRAAGPEAKGKRWRAAIAEREERAGRLDAIEGLVQGEWPEGWASFEAGRLGFILDGQPGGIALQSLFDLEQGRELLARHALPLFAVSLRHTATREDVRLAADAGWQKVASVRGQDGSVVLDWQDPEDQRLEGLRVTAKATPEPEAAAWRWYLEVDTGDPAWSVWKVTFPQVALGDLGEGAGRTQGSPKPNASAAAVLFPRGPGEIKRGVWGEAFNFRGRYPSGWCSMQFLAAYDDDGTGLYVGMHDPYAGTKEIMLTSHPGERSVRLAYEHPAPDMGRPGNGFRLSGEAVWQLLDGDWFDAAMIYKRWAREHAIWWPDLGPEGREDTPLWMRELCAWAQTGGAPAECVPAVKEMAAQLGVPTGFHWYNWHEIPFDNDYPHYFPTKAGFAAGVAELQQANVYVMPYINGRLWDTHDQGSEDFQFSSVALPAVTKNEQGKPFKEKYGSKEADGNPVWLGVMCPSTKLWQDKVNEIVLRLQNEEGVAGVYIDQIAAAAPKLCMDETHGHPLGGGHWWNEGHWHMLDSLRKSMGDDKMLTTECNAEPFIAWMDGYLTWHWQYNGQVPVFPAIYGGAIQMFGRAYRGGPTKDLALRMKAGQQLVYGEQLGWLNPSLLEEAGRSGASAKANGSSPDNGSFFRQAVRLRWRLRRYFYAGEMARPPKLTGDVPTVTADWQWSGEWPVTTDAVLTGAWRIPQEKRCVLLFANVSDASVTASVAFEDEGMQPLQVTMIRQGGDVQQNVEANPFEKPMTFPAKEAFAVEFGQ